MARVLKVGLVGDHDEAITAHRAIPWALSLASGAAGLTVQPTWLHTDTLLDERAVHGYDALWCVPGSPYRRMDGALRAIHHARESGTPFLGTCGGFQHAVIEVARHVLRWVDADHEETAPDAPRAVIHHRPGVTAAKVNEPSIGETSLDPSTRRKHLAALDKFYTAVQRQRDSDCLVRLIDDTDADALVRLRAQGADWARCRSQDRTSGFRMYRQRSHDRVGTLAGKDGHLGSRRGRIAGGAVA